MLRHRNSLHPQTCHKSTKPVLVANILRKLGNHLDSFVRGKPLFWGRKFHDRNALEIQRCNSVASPIFFCMAGDFCDTEIASNKKMPCITASLQIHMSTGSMGLMGTWHLIEIVVISDHQRLSLQDLLLLVPSQELICNLQTMLAFCRCTGVNMPYKTVGAYANLWTSDSSS